MGQVGLFVVLLTVAVLTLEMVKAQDKPVISCDNIVCEGGMMCVSDVQGPSRCICPKDCSDAYLPVCSSYWIEFNNTCQMHKFACAHQINIDIHHFGKCDKKATDAPDDEVPLCEGLDSMVQFPQRYVAWMHVAREKARNPQFQLNNRIDDMSKDQLLELAKWEFNRRDLTNDDKLDEQETNLVFEELIFEACTYGFLKSCDLNKKDGITWDEWMKCLKLA